MVLRGSKPGLFVQFITLGQRILLSGVELLGEGLVELELWKITLDRHAPRRTARLGACINLLLRERTADQR